MLKYLDTLLGALNKFTFTSKGKYFIFTTKSKVNIYFLILLNLYLLLIIKSNVL